jgi:integrase
LEKKTVQEFLIPNRDGGRVSIGSLNQALNRASPYLEMAGVNHFQIRDVRAKHSSDTDNYGTSLGHSSPSVWNRHYNRRGRVVDGLGVAVAVRSLV